MIIQLAIDDDCAAARCILAIKALIPGATEAIVATSIITDQSEQALEDFGLLEGLTNFAQDAVDEIRRSEESAHRRITQARKLLRRARK